MKITQIDNQITQIKDPITQIRDGRFLIPENRDPLTERIIACCYKVHNELGPGFVEKVYHNALKSAFEESRLNYDTECSYTIKYQDKKVGILRLDLLVEGKVIVEVKSVVGKLPTTFKSQVLSYLKVAELKLALLVNFGNTSCEIKRLAA